MAYKRTRARSRAPSRYRRRRSYRYRRTNTTRPARSYRKRRMSSRRSRKKVPVSKFVLAQLDPFSDKVAGVKIPDANTQPSATSVVEDEWSLTTGTTYGTQVLALRPFVSKMFVGSASVTSGSTWTWPVSYGGTTASSKAGTIQANNILVRTCAFGARISCALSPNNVTGYIHICLAPLNDYQQSTWTLPASVAEMQNSPYYKRYPLAVLTQRPLKLVSKILDENAFRYISPSASLDASGDNMTLHHSGWAPLVIACTGVTVSGTAVTAVSVESILHLETIPTVNSSSGTSPAANDSSQQREMATNVANSTPAGRLEGSGRSSEDVVMSSAGSGSGSSTWSLGEGIKSLYLTAGDLQDRWYQTEIYQEYHLAEESARAQARQYLTNNGLNLLLQYFGANRGNVPLLTG